MPYRIAQQVKARLESPTLWWRMGVVGVFLLGVTSLMVSTLDALDDRERSDTVQDLRSDVETLRAQLECRADVIDEVNQLETAMVEELGLGLASFSEDNETELIEHTANVRSHAAALATARMDMADAQTRCETRAGPAT